MTDLTSDQLASIHLGRVRLCNSAAVAMRDGKYYPIDKDDPNALATAHAANVLDDMLRPYQMATDNRPDDVRATGFVHLMEQGQASLPLD